MQDKSQYTYTYIIRSIKFIDKNKSIAVKTESNISSGIQTTYNDIYNVIESYRNFAAEKNMLLNYSATTYHLKDCERVFNVYV